MSKAALGLSPAENLSKLDRTDWTRATFRAAHAMARRMVRDRATHGTGEALTVHFRGPKPSPSGEAKDG